MKNKSLPLLTIILTGLVSVLILSRLKLHTDKFESNAGTSLESSNGYIQITLNLAREMESQYQLKSIRRKSAPADSAAGAVQNLLLSDPPVKGNRVQHNNNESLILTKISQGPGGEYVATFDYEGHKFEVKAGEKLLGRTVRKITIEKVYMNSTLMLFLYDINGKKLVKRKA